MVPDFAQVGELRALVLAAFHLPGELRQRQHRDGQFLGDGLQPLGELADLQHAVFRPGAGGGAHQLEIVDHHQRQPLGALQPPAAGAQRGQRDGRRVVDLDRQRGDVAADGDELVEILLADIAAADTVAGDAGFFRQQAGGELFGAHFQREYGDLRLGERVGVFAATLGEQRLGGAIGDLGRERSLAHAGAAGEDDQVGGMQPAGCWNPDRAIRWSGRTRGRSGGRHARRRGSPRSARVRMK